MLFNSNVNTPIKVLINYEENKLAFIINYKKTIYKIKFQLCKILNESQINKLINEKIEYEKLKLNCSKAKLVLNWQNESLKLLSFYNKIVGQTYTYRNT